MKPAVYCYFRFAANPSLLLCGTSLFLLPLVHFLYDQHPYTLIHYGHTQCYKPAADVMNKLNLGIAAVGGLETLGKHEPIGSLFFFLFSLHV